MTASFDHYCRWPTSWPTCWCRTCCAPGVASSCSRSSASPTSWFAAWAPTSSRSMSWARALKGWVDPDQFELLRGTRSLPVPRRRTAAHRGQGHRLPGQRGDPHPGPAVSGRLGHSPSETRQTQALSPAREAARIPDVSVAQSRTLAIRSVWSIFRCRIASRFSGDICCESSRPLEPDSAEASSWS